MSCVPWRHVTLMVTVVSHYYHIIMYLLSIRETKVTTTVAYIIRRSAPYYSVLQPPCNISEILTNEMSRVCIWAMWVWPWLFTNYPCPITETGDKTTNINAKTQFITPVNGIMAHQKQQKIKIRSQAIARIADRTVSNHTWYPIGHFLIMVLWNQAAISNGFRDNERCMQRNGWHDLDSTSK